MRKLIFVILTIIINFQSRVFAAPSTWIFWSCVTDYQVIRKWDLTIDTIPCVISELIDVMMWIAWTISVIFIIIWAYQMLFGSLSKDNAKWKQTIIFAITWFVLASFSWLIIKFILDNLGWSA